MYPTQFLQSETTLAEDIRMFNRLLNDETQLLGEWFSDHVFTEDPSQFGLEVECFLLDDKNRLLFKNLDFIKSLDKSYLVPEVGGAHLEINTLPFELKRGCLKQLDAHVHALWDACALHAKDNGSKLILIGSCPTAEECSHHSTHLTPKERYHQIDANMAYHRENEDIQIRLSGVESLNFNPQSLAVNGLLSSLHIHSRVGLSESVKRYNVSQFLIAPVLAASVNSPFIYSRNLWQESRIPMFEQVMNLHTSSNPEGFPCCFFGRDYLQSSFFELFEQNNSEIPRLSPMIDTAKPQEEMYHVRMQNSVVYRWNRPIVEFDDQGNLHLRIEYRSLPSGPTLSDMIANAIFLIGLVNFYTHEPLVPEEIVPFAYARDNFYLAALKGMDSKLYWRGKEVDVQSLLLEQLIPQAKIGMERMDLDPYEISHYLHIIKDRVKKRATGSRWQEDYIKNYGPDFQQMMSVYLSWQAQDIPVSQWKLKE